jgi:hypothetical protein
MYLVSATPTKRLIEFLWNFTVVVHNLQMCKKEYRCCLKFRRGGNSTYTFTKRGVVYLWWPLDVCSWWVYFGDGMLCPKQHITRTVSDLTEWYPPLAILWCSNFGMQVY